MQALSIAASFVIGGLVLIQLLGVNQITTHELYRSGMERNTIEVAGAYAELVEQDLRRVGLALEDPRSGIESADSTSITFLGDLDNDGAPDRIRYELGSRDEASNTSNPHDRILYRLVNGEPRRDTALGVTRFRLTFRSSSGSETTDWGAVRRIEYELSVAPLDPMDERDPILTTIAGVVYPRNLAL